MTLSHYLPNDFDAERPIAIIAGKGIYPMLTANAINQSGLPLKLVSMEGETEESLINEFSDDNQANVKVGQLGKLLKVLKKLNAGYVIMAGQVTPGKLFKGMHPDLKALAVLATLKRRNAETIFGAIADEIEKIGINVLDARAFLDNDIASKGFMNKGRNKPNENQIHYGVNIAKEMAKLDIGQGVVVTRGTVLAVEAFEGTNAMLKRAGSFGADKTLFVKTAKAKQDYRFDVPVFGMHTLQTMIETGIQSAALEAGSVLILEKEKVLAQAKKHAIDIIGF